MSGTTETTRVTLRFTADTAPCDEKTEAGLIAALERHGHRIRETRKLAGGVRFELDGLTLMVTRSPDKTGDVRILAFGPDDGTPGSAQAKARFRLCANTARAIAAFCPPHRIEWRHRGGFYITEGGQIAVVSGMRGTSGHGPRRKAAARAFSLYGHDTRRGRRRNRAPLPFRIGGRGHRSLAEKLAQYAINATICVFSLPFGAAVITYDLLRGGSLAHSARWVALSALAMSFVNLEALQQLSTLF